MTSTRPGSDTPAPTTEAAKPPRALASTPLLRQFRPLNRPAMKPAAKLSPAPVVSCTSTLKAGTEKRASPVPITQPARPRFKITASRP